MDSGLVISGNFINCCSIAVAVPAVDGLNSAHRRRYNSIPRPSAMVGTKVHIIPELRLQHLPQFHIKLFQAGLSQAGILDHDGVVVRLSEWIRPLIRDIGQDVPAVVKPLGDAFDGPLPPLERDILVVVELLHVLHGPEVLQGTLLGSRPAVGTSGSPIRHQGRECCG